MNARLRVALGSAVLVGAGLTLPHCELFVNLDRGEVEAGPPDGCAICTPLGTEDGAVDGGDDAESADGTLPESGSTDAGSDATSQAGGGDGAAQDAGADG